MAFAIPIGILLVAAFALASTLSAREQQATRAPEGFNWGTIVPFDPLGIVSIVGRELREGSVTLTQAIVSRYAGAKLGALTAYFRDWRSLTVVAGGTFATFAMAVSDALTHQHDVVIPRIRRDHRQLGKRVGILAGALAAEDAALKAFKRAQGRNNAKQADRIGDAARKGARAGDKADRAAKEAVKAKDQAKGAQRVAQKALARTVPAAMAGTIAAVMVGRLGFRWWRCSNFRRFGRSLNCSHWGFLLDLFALPITALLVSDACRISGAVVSASESAVTYVMKPVVGLTDMICTSGGGTIPSGTTKATYSGPWLPSGF